MLKQTVQITTERANLFCGAYGILHLPKNLRFTQHHGIQSGGDTQRLTHRILICMMVEVGPRIIERHPRMLHPPCEYGLGGIA